MGWVKYKTPLRTTLNQDPLLVIGKGTNIRANTSLSAKLGFAGEKRYDIFIDIEKHRLGLCVIDSGLYRAVPEYKSKPEGRRHISHRLVAVAHALKAAGYELLPGTGLRPEKSNHPPIQCEFDLRHLVPKVKE